MPSSGRSTPATEERRSSLACSRRSSPATGSAPISTSPRSSRSIPPRPWRRSRKPRQRRRVRELMVLLEMCRHPESPEQIALVDSFAAAMGEDGVGLQLAAHAREGGHRARVRRLLPVPRRRDPPLGGAVARRPVSPHRRTRPGARRPARRPAQPSRGNARVGVHRVLPPPGPAAPRAGPLHPRVLRGARHEPCHRGIPHDRPGGDGTLGDDPRHGRHATTTGC